MAETPQVTDSKAIVLDLVQTCLATLATGGSRGRKTFLSTLAPKCVANHARSGMIPSNLTIQQLAEPPYNKPKLQYEGSPEAFAARIPWDSIGPGDMREGLDGEATVLDDGDVAMVWYPYWFLNRGELTHVGTNCFTLLYGDWEEFELDHGLERGFVGGAKEWKIVGMSDTARLPSGQDRKRLAYSTQTATNQTTRDTDVVLSTLLQ